MNEPSVRSAVIFWVGALNNGPAVAGPAAPVPTALLRLKRPVSELSDKSFKATLTLPSIIILENLRAVEGWSAVSLVGG